MGEGGKGKGGMQGKKRDERGEVAWEYFTKNC